MKRAAHLLGARQFAVVGVEFLGQDQEPPDLRARHGGLLGQRSIDRVDVLLDQRGDAFVSGELLIGGVGNAVALGPVADRGEFDVEHDRDKVALVADRDSLADIGEELELVLDIFGREQLPVGELAHVLGAVDDLELPVRLEEAGVAGFDEAVLGQRFPGLVRLVVIADEHARRLELHLAVLGDAQLHMRRGRADRVGAHGAVGLRGDIEKSLGLAVELLQVEPERAIEREQVRADRLAGGIGDANAREAERVLQRAIDQEIAERVMQPREPRHGLPVGDLLAPSARDAHEMAEQPALGRARVLHPDHHARQQRLEHARRREMEGRADLAQIFGGGRRAFRAGHAEARRPCPARN